MKRITISENTLRSIIKTAIKESIEQYRNMTNIEVLKNGLAEIAENHGLMADTEHLEEEGNACVYSTGKDVGVPVVADVRGLCEELGLPSDCVDVSDFGVDVNIPYNWYVEKGNEKFNGEGLWGRF